VTTVSKHWRTVALALLAVLILSWAFFVHQLLDAGVSLMYCRDERENIHRDVEFLMAVGSRRLSAGWFLDIRNKLEPELPLRLDAGNTLLLKSLTLQYDEDSVLAGIANP